MVDGRGRAAGRKRLLQECSAAAPDLEQNVLRLEREKLQKHDEVRAVEERIDVRGTGHASRRTASATVGEPVTEDGRCRRL